MRQKLTPITKKKRTSDGPEKEVRGESSIGSEGSGADSFHTGSVGQSESGQGRNESGMEGVRTSTTGSSGVNGQKDGIVIVRNRVTGVKSHIPLILWNTKKYMWGPTFEVIEQIIDPPEITEFKRRKSQAN